MSGWSGDENRRFLGSLNLSPIGLSNELQWIGVNIFHRFRKIKTIFRIANFCAKRSLRPSASQNQMFRLSVRSENNYFLRSGYRGVVRCLTTVGFWKPDFLEVEKKWSLCTYPRQMLSALDPLLDTFFELLKNMFLTWIASVDKKVEESRRLGVVVSGKFA